jgi:hypothetical protein
VLQLVLAHGDDRGLVQQDVRRHEHGVLEEAGEDVLLLRPLVLELRHALEVPERRDVREVPRELGVLAHVALHEQGAARRIEPARHEVARHALDARAKLGRVVLVGDRVRVDDAEDEVLLLLGDLRGPGAHRAEPVADVELAGRLDAGEDARAAHGAKWIE